MAVGTGSVTLQNIPAVPYVIDPDAFFAMTNKNVLTAKTLAAPGAGSFVPQQLPQVGIISKLQLVFEGTVTVDTAAATSSMRWPYGLLSNFTLSANGQNELINLDGEDLTALRFLRYPAFDDEVDVFPGTLGGGDTVAVGTYDLYLTWEVPIAMDDTSLIGALYAQSSATNLNVRLGQAINAQLFSANPGNVTIDGTFSLVVTNYEIPFDAQGNIVIPDLTRMHGLNAVDTAFTQTGDVPTSLIRSAGVLERLLVSMVSGSNARLSALPSAAAANTIDAVRLQYGGNQTPYNYDPAAALLSINNQHYGAPVPYERLVFDFVRENPARDVILLQGVTELQVVPTVNSAATITAGATRLLQETLF